MCHVDPKIRVLIREMPRLMRDILESTISTQFDMEIVSEDIKPPTMSTATIPPDVVIIGATRSEDVRNLSVALLEWPRVQVVMITTDGNESTMYELAPQKTALGEVSPLELIDAIRLRLQRTQSGIMGH